MLSRFHLILERHGQTDGRMDRQADRQTDRQNCYINIARQCADARDKKRDHITTRKMGQLTVLWRSRAISNKLKAKLVQALVWPIVKHGCETWTITKDLRDNMIECDTKAR